MATAGQHNQILKVIFDGSKHLNHVLDNDQIKKMTLYEGRFPLTKLPVCGHCEKLGLWHKDELTKKPVGVCTACGAITRKPLTYSSYLAAGYDIDQTGDSFRRMAIVDKQKDLVNRHIYLPDTKRLEEQL